MKFVVDVMHTATCSKEIVLDADDANTARVGAEIAVERKLGGQLYLDRADWDTIELDGELEGLHVERLLDRRTRERAEALRHNEQCDACDAEPVRTARYGDARVCSPCLSKLPPLAD